MNQDLTKQTSIIIKYSENTAIISKTGGIYRPLLHQTASIQLKI